MILATRSIGDPEGGPPGYTLLYFQADDFATTFRSIEDHGPIVLITHPREKLLATSHDHVVQGPDRVVVRVWHTAGVSAVRYRIDADAWVELEPAIEGHWAGPLDGSRLAKGEHSLEVIAVGDDSAEGSQKIGFMVDPTGRYTPVPEVRPVVNSTAFD